MAKKLKKAKLKKIYFPYTNRMDNSAFYLFNLISFLEY